MASLTAMDHRYSPTQRETTLCQILKEAQHRWLRPPEVCEILRNYQKFKLTPDPPHKPQSGSLFLFDRKALRYFRKDGYNWRKKKDGRTVREAHERLKAGSVEVLHCYYAHGEDNENFQRRSYWMLDENEHIVLVHYREVKEGNRSGTHSPNNLVIEGSYVGNPKSVSGIISPRSSLVSPGSSSPNTSTDWNGTTFSSECDGPESSEDIDQYHRDFCAKNYVTRAVINSGVFQALPSVITTNQICHSYESKASALSENIDGHGGAHYHFGTVGTTQNVHIKQEKGAIRDPHAFDSLEWCEIVRQSNVHESIPAGTLPSSISCKRKDSSERIVNQGPIVIHGNTIEHPFQTGLETDPVTFTDILNSRKSSWNTSLAALNDTGRNSSSFESDVLYELGKAQKYPNLGQSCDEQDFSKLDSSDTKGIPVVESYINVLRDFQTEIPNEYIHYDSFKNYDNFSRWTSQDKWEDIESTQQLSSDITYWANTLVEEGANSTEMMRLDVKLPSFSQEMCFNILDISPNYALSTVGAKVLIVGDFSNTVEDPSKSKWCCIFGDVKVDVEYLHPGVLRCNAPRHVPGKILLYITRDDGIVCSESKEFEYIADSKWYSDSAERTFSYKMDMLFQIRLARMLSKEIPVVSQCTKPEQLAKDLSSALNSLSLFEEWEQMEDELTQSNFLAMNSKEQFIEKLLKEKLQKWLLKKLEDGGKCAAVLDDNGLGVLHMGAALGYTWVITPMLAAGVKVNFRDSRGWTALHWAAHCGRESMVVALLANGADPGAKTDPTSAFPAGQMPADLAAAEHHKGIAGYLAESSLTSHLSRLNLKTDVDESVLTDDAVETLSEKIITKPNAGESQEQLSLQDSLAAARNAAQAVARIQYAFRALSFKKKQESCSIEENEYGISSEEAQCIIAAQKSTRTGLSFDDGISEAAAIRIQQKYRGWKGRRAFLLFRQHVVRIQAHFRGQQVRRKYKKIVWSVSIVEKAILRWRRKGRGLRGFESAKLNAHEQQSSDADDDFLKAGRKQIEAGLEKSLARVHSMVRSPEARDQYRRLLEGYQKTKEQSGNGSSKEPVFGDLAMTTD